MTKQQEGMENAAFHANAKESEKTHHHDHDELPMDMLGAEKTFQVSTII